MKMKRRENDFPLEGGDFPFGFLRYMWESGWLDDFSEQHFLIKVIEDRLSSFVGERQANLDNTAIYPIISKNNFTETFLMNFSVKMQGLSNAFGEKQIERFVRDQLSAGKKNYNEEQFFRALSEISVIAYILGLANWKEKIYEPQLNNKKNPEVRLITDQDVIIDIEVKTPGFNQNNINEKKLMPTVLLTKEGKEAIKKHCEENNMICLMPRVGKLKDFINSAAEKFELPQDDKHLNLLFINWSYSEFAPDAYQEAYSLLVNPVNGIIRNKEIGMKMGISEEAYEKISAIIVYSDSLNGLAFLDLRHIWIKQKFRMIAINPNIEYKRFTGMNPDLDPEAIVCVLGDEDYEFEKESPTLQAIPIIKKYMLK